MLETISVVVALLTFVYMAIWGKDSIADSLERRRRRAEKARQVREGVPAAPQVFLSYSRRDMGFVERLAWDLKSVGLVVWYDLSGLRVGSRWGMEIQKAIAESRYFIVALSPHSVTSEWVEREFLYASQRRLRIIPVLVAECELPIWAIDMQYIDMRDARYTKNLNHLLAALDVLQSAPTAPSPAIMPEAISVKPIPPGPASPAAKPQQRGHSGGRVRPLIKLPWDARKRWRLGSGLAGAALGFALWLLVLSSPGRIAGLELRLLGGVSELQLFRSTVGPSSASNDAIESLVATLPPVEATESARLTLESIDPLFGTAVGETRTRAPTYKTDFQNWGGIAELQPFTVVQDGALVVTSQGPGAMQVVRRMKTSDYAVAFDYRIKQGSGACEFMTTNDQFDTSNWRGFDLLLYDVDGKIELGRNVWPGDFERLFMSSTGMDFRQFHTATVILLKNAAAVFVDDALQVARSDPDGAPSYTHQSLGANLGSVCEFDSFRAWDLRDVVQ